MGWTLIRRIQDNNGENRIIELLNWIDEILMLPKGSTKLGKTGLTVDGPWGKNMSLGGMGDGPRVTISWLSDMFGWAFYFDENMFDKELSGIVIIDEIEQHLHPKMQRNIIRLLSEKFRKIQFVTTSHSPLVAANADLVSSNKKISKIFYLSFNGRSSGVSEVREKLGMLDYNQILSSEAFGHMTNFDPQISDTFKRASQLASKDNLTNQEREKLNTFKQKLMPIMFPEGQTLIEREVERDYYRQLEHKIEELKKILED